MNQSLAGKKVLILYTAHTMGHQRIAENIGWWLSRDGATVVLREVLKSNPSPAVRRFLKVHVWVNEHAPWFWKFMYLWGFWVAMMPFRLLAAALQKGEIEKIVTDERPDLVITTQTSPSAVMSVLKRDGVFAGPWGIAFSDYHFHRAWVYPRADFYLPNIPEQLPHLQRLGVPKDRIRIIGMALPPRTFTDGLQLRRQLGISEKSKVVLVGSGSLGIRVPQQLFRALLDVRLAGEVAGMDIQFIFLCGKNKALYNAILSKAQELPWNIPLLFYEPMADVYATSDLMISKPGGLTIAETVQRGLPVFVTHYLPGQEELNIEYLDKQNVIIPLYRQPLLDWAGAILEELRSGTQKAYLLNHPDLTSLVAPSGLSQLGEFVNGLFHKNLP